MKMNNLKLVHYPNPILDKPLEIVDIKNPGFDPVQLKSDMINLMLLERGIGLSANQVGLNKTLFVMGDSHANVTLCINPKFSADGLGDMVEDYEGCLSFPGVFVKITRPRKITAEFYNEKLELVVQELEDYTARCYMHELDHLLGITMKDRVSRLRWDMAVKKSKKLLRKSA